MSTHRLATSILCLLLALVACKREDAPAPRAPAPAPPPVAAPVPFRVSAIELGSAIGPDKRVTAPGATFAPGDTIYASISTLGAAPSVTLSARWTYEDGQLVSEASEVLAPTGPAVTEFHIAKPDGWPAGHYTVAVSSNGATVDSRSFEVR